ncbi:PREDICTED: DNA-directed RNA polymerases II and IV subunit 5A-like [Camelina sativa]|uniref:DNA-directed RNA polymerases II and IV subunit 5A-like n=1 Tax=Camelina sativa TaxID=90675 RepID=A0ABM1RCS6_CAMSA|nr:PREDICTED: DNA-directed RNA polymerases II and IV subunit 5A-like [Camelina sativa]
MALTDEEIKKLYLVQRTLMQMLKDRGYSIEDSEITMTLGEFIEKYGDDFERKALNTLKAKKNDDNGKLYIFFPNKPKVGVAEMKKYTNKLKSDNVFRAILVVQDIKDFSSFAQLSISAIYPKFHIEVFQEGELLVNVKSHVFVPEHQALTTDEKKTFLERYTVKENQLPKIHVTDPIARYFGLKLGEVVKITRLSETSGRYVTYRFVV